MKVVLLAGGFGTRLSEETKSIPKPMVKIGDMPIIWHIMKTYSHYGYNDFVVCLGYKGYALKEWFSNYFVHTSDITIDLSNNQLEVHNNRSEPWRVTLVETGLHTMTGGRIKRVQKYIGNEPFMLTYGDGVSDVNIAELVKQHNGSNKLLTVTAYKPQGKFGSLEIADDGNVTAFTEKPAGDGMWINAGFFVCQPEVFDFIKEGDQTIFERNPLETIASQGLMNSFKHRGFWKPMDTLRDNTELNEMWEKGKAPWKTWNE
ncbi:glucose-1-phosphate cytidylyltransferase [Breznakibacter xylanolyticus]|uniref:Glucose-1-phosphate cytidylyltransferase n=1 Tax=Breznakibacter xylanolyticus TaxID=990 RepID=A0A2W7NFL0_9BACT|nr:glucose-1-phosphate cytidylyltransferase [Breznakibacter xylanolyticus]PZX19171.1 glucose-1-phosphate cytidylyltransferase [Breznakibacter xylanolyticus]